MIKIIRTNSENAHFGELVKLLDAELRKRDGDDHAFFAQFNKIDSIKYVVVAFVDEKPVGCGAVKKYDDDIMEIKRMFVEENFRGRGIASSMLMELEKWTTEMNFKKCILETGVKQPEAVSLYKKCGYTITPNYGQYINVKTSVCFEKLLN